MRRRCLKKTEKRKKTEKCKNEIMKKTKRIEKKKSEGSSLENIMKRRYAEND